MARIVLVTGGCRSGKSAYALKCGEQFPGPRAYVATCQAVDAEMQERILEHQKARGDMGWQTIEEPLDLAGTLTDADQYNVVLVDCLTLWINNLLYEAEKSGCSVDEHDVERRCDELLLACSDHPGVMIFVTNEVGMGIVPENAVARHFRDLAGRCNQVMARGADTVTFVACGIPMNLKGS